MLQHLLNTTAIWLISLLLFDLLLRKETYHQYNRIYLLGTFLLGLVLPAFECMDIAAMEQSRSPIVAPLHQITVAKQQVLTTATEPVKHSSSAQHSTIDPVSLAAIIYFIGTAVSLAMLIRECILLLLYYKQGRRTEVGKWTLIETGKEHGPFSFASYLFVSRRSNYTDEQWQIIIDHEQQHEKLCHWIDTTLLQVAGIILWFHPLVYAYGRRVRLLHEYQADVVGTTSPGEYGRFLLQQSLLLPAPVMTHSFNRSPIRNRIMMLTRSTSSKVHLAKMLVVFPMLAVCFACCSKGGEKKDTSAAGQTVVHEKPYIKEKNGNKVLFSGGLTIKGPGKVFMQRYAEAEQLNGNKLYNEWEASTLPVVAATGEQVKRYVFSRLKPLLCRQKNDKYIVEVSNMVVDERGKLVYYELSLEKEKAFVLATVTPEIVTATQEIIDEMPPLNPAILNGKPVPFVFNRLFDLNDVFIVKDGKTALRRMKGVEEMKKADYYHVKEQR